MKSFQQFLAEAFQDKDHQLNQDYLKLTISFGDSVERRREVIKQVKFIQSLMKDRPESVKKLTLAGLKELEDDYVDWAKPINVFELAMIWVEGSLEDVCKYLKIDSDRILEQTKQGTFVLLPEYMTKEFTNFKTEFDDIKSVVEKVVEKFDIDVEVTDALINKIKKVNDHN